MDDVWPRSLHGAADPTALDGGQQWSHYLSNPSGHLQSSRRGHCERQKPFLYAPSRPLAARAERSMLRPRQAINAEDHHASRPDCIDPAPRGRAPNVGH